MVKPNGDKGAPYTGGTVGRDPPLVPAQTGEKLANSVGISVSATLSGHAREQGSCEAAYYHISYLTFRPTHYNVIFTLIITPLPAISTKFSSTHLKMPVPKSVETALSLINNKTNILDLTVGPHKIVTPGQEIPKAGTCVVAYVKASAPAICCT